MKLWGEKRYYSLDYYANTDQIYASLYWFGPTNNCYSTYVSLDVKSYETYGIGSTCSGEYSIYSGGKYVTQNEANWILNSPTFNSSSTITNVWYYDGMQSSQSTILTMYKLNICDTLDWLSDYFYDNNIGVTLKDIGFIAYE